MSGGGSYNQSKANNQSQFNQSIPKWQSDALTKMYGAAANTFGSTGNAIAGQTPAAQSYIDQTNQAAMPE